MPNMPSEKTAQTVSKEEKRPGWLWTINIDKLKGRRIRVETRDGVYRSGTLDSMEMRVVTFLGREVSVPSALIVGGDEIPFDRISKVTDEAA